MKTSKIISLLLAAVLLLGLAACGGKPAEAQADPSDSTSAAAPAESASPAAQEAPSAPEAPAAPKILKLAESFAYASLDAHKDWNGWYTSSTA